MKRNVPVASHTPAKTKTYRRVWDEKNEAGSSKAVPCARNMGSSDQAKKASFVDPAWKVKGCSKSSLDRSLSSETITISDDNDDSGGDEGDQSGGVGMREFRANATVVEDVEFLREVDLRSEMEQDLRKGSGEADNVIIIDFVGSGDEDDDDDDSAGAKVNGDVLHSMQSSSRRGVNSGLSCKEFSSDCKEAGYDGLFDSEMCKEAEVHADEHGHGASFQFKRTVEGRGAGGNSRNLEGLTPPVAELTSSKMKFNEEQNRNTRAEAVDEVEISSSEEDNTDSEDEDYSSQRVSSSFSTDNLNSCSWEENSSSDKDYSPEREEEWSECEFTGRESAYAGGLRERKSLNKKKLNDFEIVIDSSGDEDNGEGNSLNGSIEHSCVAHRTRSHFGKEGKDMMNVGYFSRPLCLDDDDYCGGCETHFDDHATMRNHGNNNVSCKAGPSRSRKSGYKWKNVPPCSSKRKAAANIDGLEKMEKTCGNGEDVHLLFKRKCIHSTKDRYGDMSLEESVASGAGSLGQECNTLRSSASLPLKFTSGLKEPAQPEKSEDEKQQDNLWEELNFSHRSCKTEPSNRKNKWKNVPSQSSKRKTAANIDGVEKMEKTCVNGEDFQSLSKKKYIHSPKDHNREISPEEVVASGVGSLGEEHNKRRSTPSLPLKFTFGCKEPEQPEKSEFEKQLDNLWKELDFSLRSCEVEPSNANLVGSKDAGPESNLDRATLCQRGNHEYILDEEIGLKCKYCSSVQVEIRYIVPPFGKRTRGTYMSEGRYAEGRDSSGSVGFKVQDSVVAEVYAHPWHMQQMKPHQAEGFNFLVRNLVTDYPGGCILAHAPGSGKTFMIISFIQSFLGKYPNARPLVILPKGILATWKKEFQKWQVEDIKLLDFYTKKAENRAQQLEVLKLWIVQKSILFLGYKQFSTIIYDAKSSKQSASCQEILLKAPSLLILDEGHTPRNEETDVLQSLAKVQTPRKVVLSGTLYQNHVKEVFNILNLVRPKFLKLDASRIAIERITSRVTIPGFKKQLKAGAEVAFYDLVEHTLQKDTNLERKVALIQDLREMTKQFLHYYRGDFLDELPGLVDFTVLLNLSSKQRHEVEKLKGVSRPFKINAVGSAVYLHPELNVFSDGKMDEYSVVKKMDQMLAMLDVKQGVKAKFFLNILKLCESAGEKLLVFGQYLIPLKFLMRLVMKAKGWALGREIFFISGASSAEDRERSVGHFNNSADAKILFGSVKACGEGISLVGASRVLILDVHLNPSVTRQAIGRAFRPGQEKKVYVYRLVAADSPEEKDHKTCLKKEMVSKMWFEWNECCGFRDFDVELETPDVKECGDPFLESPVVNQDVRTLYKRP